MGHASSILDEDGEPWNMYLLDAATESLRAGIRIGPTESTRIGRVYRVMSPRQPRRNIQ
jgi:hypothetical protein